MPYNLPDNVSWSDFEASWVEPCEHGEDERDCKECGETTVDEEELNDD